MSKEIHLPEPPKDGISSLSWSAGGEHLLASSWDTSVRLYDATTNTAKSNYHHKAAVLGACFGSSGNIVYSGGLDLTVKEHNFASGDDRVLGSHTAAVRCLEFSATNGLLLTGSWDKTMKAWDPRAPSPEVSAADCEERVYSMSLCGQSTVLVATAAKQVLAFDLRKMAAKESPKLWAREPGLRHQIRCVRAFADGDVYAVGSIEGRCAIEFVSDAPTVQANKYTFKCHRQKLAGGDERVFPVNCMATHPRAAVFATGGADGVVNCWDPTSKKRLAQLAPYPTSISSLAFSPDGAKLAVAVSYTYEQGAIEHPADDIVIRTMLPAEITPRAR